MRHLLKQAVLAFLFVALPALLLAQVSVTGTVTDAKNNPLQGVSVKVKNSNTGASTDASGKFNITVPKAGTILEFSSVGYKTQSLQAKEGTITIVMTDDVGRLDEVVVTGLATSVKRRNLANAVATISSKDLAGTAPAQTFDAALNGKIPGALINANSGAPGGGVSVKLRGVNSVYGNTQPLFVVDGVFMDNSSVSTGLNAVSDATGTGSVTSDQDNATSRIADIRAEDIENVEILKGASAAAIYGSKAAAGVVIITTKKGKSGQTKISFSQDLGFVKARKLLGQRTWNEERAASLGGTDDDLREYFREMYVTARDAGKIYDYEKEMYGETGLTRNSILNIVGGNEKTSFYFSAGLKDEEGIVKNTGYKSKSLRLNVDHRINDRIKIGVATAYVNSGADRGFNNNDNTTVTNGMVLPATPNFVELHPNEFKAYPNNPFAGANPLHTRDVMVNFEGINRFTTGLNLDAVLQKSNTSATRFIARGGFDYYTQNSFVYFPGELQFQVVNQGTSIRGNTRNLNYNYILSLVNTLTPTDNLSFTTSAGLTQENKNYDNIMSVATRLIPGQTNVTQGSALRAYQFRDIAQDNGIFFQEEATIMNAITVTGGVRLDRSSNNGDASKFYVYPKAGLSWNLTQMSFFKQNIFDNLKFRVAFGQAGNFPVYGSKFTLMSTSNIDGNTGLLVSTLRGSKLIEPERTSELEGGVDMSFLGGKLNLEFTVYNKKVMDFLLQRSLAGSTGSSAEYINAGNLRNRGIEIGLNAQPVTAKNFTWRTTVNFWKNKSMVTSLKIPPVTTGAFSATYGIFRIEEGKSATQIIGNIGAGKGTGVIGNTEPDFQMNFSNEISFMKNFTLRFLIHWKKGGDNINLSEFMSDGAGTSADYDDEPNKDGLTKAQARLARFRGRFADAYTQDAGYIRLREAALFYSFSKSPVSFIKGLRIGISANNFLTITKYRGYDPEVSNFGTGFSSSVDIGPFPASKRATFHLSVDL